MLESGSPEPTQIGPSSFDFVVDTHSSIVSNFQALRNIQLHQKTHALQEAQTVDLGADRDIHICVLGDCGESALAAEQESVLIRFLQHLCYHLSIPPELIVVESGPSVTPDGGSVSMQAPGSILPQEDRIRDQVSVGSLLSAEDRAYMASFEVYYIEEAADGFRLAGWLSNTGTNSWLTDAGEDSVQIGVRLLKTGLAVVAELRFQLALDRVSPGVGFAFDIEIPFNFEEFTRCEFGVLIEHKFWFSDVGRRPVGVEVSALHEELASQTPQKLGVPGVLVVTYGDDRRRKPALQDSAVEPANFVVTKNCSAESLADLNRILNERAGWDVVVLQQGIVPEGGSWMRRLVLTAHAVRSLAAVAAPVVNDAARIIDLGGELYSSGYTHTPGFEQECTAAGVITYRDPAFLPAGVVYIKDRALREVGIFHEELTELQAALIEWCYRARSKGFSVRIVHGGLARVLPDRLTEMLQPPIRSHKTRLRVLKKLSGLCIEALNG